MMQAFKTYYKQSADKLNLVNTVMLESTEEAYKAAVSDIAAKIERSQYVLNTETGEVISGVTAYNAAVRDGVRKMVDNGLTGFIDHGGHRWTPESYVAMDIKTTMHNTAREAVWERNKDYGNDLYQVSSHNGARPLCYPWQGKVLSTSGRTGTTTDLDGNVIQIHSEDEVESFRYGGGLFGVNCGHYPMVFIPGVSTIKADPQSPEENAETYAESQQQRALERKLREEKRELEIMKAQGAPDEEIRAQRAKVRLASSDIDAFCDETGRTRRRANEYTPVNASFPDKGSYDLTEFPTETRDKVLDFLSPKSTSKQSRNASDGKQKIATIKNKEVYSRWGDISPVVILTDERKGHILDRHESDFSEFGRLLQIAIESPDYILEDERNEYTAMFIRHVDKSNMNVLVKLAIVGNDDGYDSSIMTMHKVGQKTLNRLIKKHQVLYKSK